MQPNMYQRPVGFDFGWVLSKGFSVFFRQFPTFMLLSLIVFAPLFIYGYLVGYPGNDFHGPFAQMSQILSFTIVLAVASAILQPVLAGAVISGTVDELSGRRAGFGRSLATGLRRMLPTLAVSILVAVSTALGVIALIVGAYVVMCMLYVAVPVSVIEKPGVFAALSRSAELTKGYRWWVFLLVFVIGAIVGLGGTLLELAAVDHDEIGPGIKIVSEHAWGTYKWLHIMLATFGGALGACLQATLYVHLRNIKDGVGVGDLAKVFD